MQICKLIGFAVWKLWLCVLLPVIQAFLIENAWDANWGNVGAKLGNLANILHFYQWTFKNSRTRVV